MFWKTITKRNKFDFQIRSTNFAAISSETFPILLSDLKLLDDNDVGNVDEAGTSPFDVS